MQLCWAYTVAKAKQKYVIQFSLDKKIQVPGERVLIYMLAVQPPEGVVALPRANWRIIFDECTNFKVAHFFRGKIRWLRQPASCSSCENI